MRTVQRFVLLSLVTASLMAQKVETQPLDNQKVIRVDTAPDHLTVIELADPVTMVAVGNQSAFQVERRENKVFVRPVEEGAQTNLFVWTTAARFSYELAPAASVAKMHFAIDQAPQQAHVAPAPLVDELPQKTAPLPAEMLTEAAPISLFGEREIKGRVVVTLHDLYRQPGRLFLRYRLVNRSVSGYQAARPAVFRMAGVRAPVSLFPIGESQLGERLARAVKFESVSRLDVLEASPAPFLEPSAEALGWLAVPETDRSSSDPALIRLEFAADSRGPVEAYLVVRSVTRKESDDARRAGE